MDLIFANWRRFKKKAEDRTEKNVFLFNYILDFYHIDKAVHLPVFKLDKNLSLRMNSIFPERIYGFGHINPKSKSLEADLEELRQKHYPGIKIHPDFMNFTFQSAEEELIQIFRFCAEHDIKVLSHTGSHSKLLNLIPILKKCDDVDFIIGHSGLCPQIEQALELARQCPNSYLETSGNPYTYKFMEAIRDPDIGVERILFGTDIPSLNPIVEIQKILVLPISVEERRRIFSMNLKNLLSK